MSGKQIEVTKITNGVFYINIEKADTRILCGTPSDIVKHLMKKKLMIPNFQDGFFCESGPNAILLSDLTIQNYSFSNLCEFPVLQMLYRQGMVIPNHPNNNGEKPIIMGLKEQVESQIEYIFRGNYGLVSKEEIEETGVSSELAEQMMNMKLKFAFGSIRSSAELLHSIYLDDNSKTEIKSDVQIQRLGLNNYKISFEDEEIEVDLNLKENESYDVPYELEYHNIHKSYFSVIHSGQGDGWSVNSPSMSSIVMFHGKFYLIDTGPNIENILLSLGIGLNDIEGVFHTHGHDDHFAGLTELLRIDHRIKYYSTKLVRTSVMKKLSALLHITQERLDNCFEYIDLDENSWTNIEGLEVKPVYSPHPIETNTFSFRTFWEGGFKTYSHLADISSFKVLDGMVNDEGGIGISSKYCEETKKQYLEQVTLKKIDAGGGMIHGELVDFKEDNSEKLVIAHTSNDNYSDEQLEIGSAASFGEVDDLIPTRKDYLRSSVSLHLKALFPNMNKEKIQILLNCEIKNFEPNSQIIKEGEVNEEVYLLLSGAIKSYDSFKDKGKKIFSGTLIGDISALTENESNQSFTALSYVNALAIPKDIYTHYIGYDYLSDIMMKRMSLGVMLEDFEIFSEFLSTNTQNRITESIVKKNLEKNKYFSAEGSGLYLLATGELKNEQNGLFVKAGTPFALKTIFEVLDVNLKYKVIEDCELYFIPRDIIETIPIIYLKLFTQYQKRLCELS